MTTPQYRSYGADTQRGDRTDLTAIVTATPQVIVTLHFAKFDSQHSLIEKLSSYFDNTLGGVQSTRLACISSSQKEEEGEGAC